MLTGLGMGIASSIAGCLTEISSTDGDAESNEENSNNDTTMQIKENTSLNDLKEDCAESTSDESNALPSKVQIGVAEPNQDVYFDVTLQRQFTPEHPAKIAVLLENSANEPHKFEYPPRPLSHGEHETSDAMLKADFTDSEYDEPDEDGCWRSPGPIGGEPTVTTVELDPDERITEEYVLVAPEEADNCLPRGIYLFESEIITQPVNSGENDGADTIKLRWGICLK